MNNPTPNPQHSTRPVIATTILAAFGTAVLHADPVADPGGPYEVSASPGFNTSLDDLSLNGSGSTPDAGATTITDYDWDLNNDNDFTDILGGNDPTPSSISYNTLVGTWGMTPGANTIQLRVTDDSLLTNIASTTVTLPYVWTKYDNTTSNASFSRSWTDGTAWESSTQFVSGSGNDLAFFGGPSTYADGSNRLEQEGTLTITDVPAALSMRTLTLNGRGPNTTASTFIVIGDNTSTWTIGDGSTGTVSYNTINGGGTNVTDGITNDRWANFTLNPNLTLNQTTTFTGNSGGVRGLVLTGNIGEAAPGYGLTKSGSHRLVLEGTNNYTGTTTVSSGNLYLGSANALPGGAGVSGGTSALTLSGGVLELASGDFLRNLGTGSDQFQISGNSGFSALGSHRTISVNNDPATVLTWGSGGFSPNTFKLNASSAVAPGGLTRENLTLTNDIDLGNATRTFEVSAKTVFLTGDISNSSGTGIFRKTGGGTLLLTGNTTYNGNTRLGGGVLGPADNLGNGSGNLIFEGGTLRVDGTALTSFSGLAPTYFANTVINNNVIVGFEISDPDHTFTVDTNLTNGSGAVYSDGPGTVVLNGANTFTGRSRVSGGGTMVLDYTTEDNAKISTDRLRVGPGGGELILRGGTHTQTVNQVEYQANAHISFSRDGGSTATINLNNPGVAQRTRTASFSEDGIATSDKTNSNGSLGGQMTVGSHFAKNSTDAADGPIVALEPSDYTIVTTSGGSSTDNLELTGSQTLTGNITGNTLRLVNSGNDDVLDLNTRSLRISRPSGAGGIIYAGGANNNYTITSSTGNISTQNNNQPQHINVFTGTLNIESRVFSGTSSSYSLTKYGEGTLNLSADNIYSGRTYVLQGTLLVNNTTGSGTGSGIIEVNGGTKLGGTGTIAGNVFLQKYGGLTFDLSTAPGSHDKLDIDTGSSLTIAGDSILTLTSSGGASTGLYTLLTAAGGITGDAPNFVNLPAGWTADAPVIVGNDLQINITSVGSGSTPYDDWAAGPFTNPFNDTLPTDNPDGDSLSNLLEFAFGTDPTVSDGTSLTWSDPGFTPGTPVVVHSFPGGGGVDFKARFIRRANDAGDPGSVSYALRFSSDLSDWESSSDGPAPTWWVPGNLTVLETDGDYELVEYPYPFFLDAGPKARFFQLEVTEVP